MIFKEVSRKVSKQVKKWQEISILGALILVAGLSLPADRQPFVTYSNALNYQSAAPVIFNGWHAPMKPHQNGDSELHTPWFHITGKIRYTWS